MLSVVVPAYNEGQLIHTAAERIADLLVRNEIEYELIFVYDGSTDSTWKEICTAAKDNSNIRGISFSRNFGKESAIFAGLCEVKGECAAVIDCDLQQPPEKLIDMYDLWKKGYQVIEGVKADRGRETVFHSFAASAFYRLMSDATNRDFRNASDFKLLDRKVVDIITSIPEKNMFFRAMSAWVGFKTAEVPYEVEQRAGGKSKWS